MYMEKDLPLQCIMEIATTVTWGKTYLRRISWRCGLHLDRKGLPPQCIMEMWTTFTRERPTSTVHHGDVDYIYKGKTYLHSISCRCGLHLHRKETYLHSASWRCGLHWTERLFVYMLCEEYGTSRSAGVAHSPLPHRSHLGSIS